MLPGGDTESREMHWSGKELDLQSPMVGDVLKGIQPSGKQWWDSEPLWYPRNG